MIPIRAANPVVICYEYAKGFASACDKGFASNDAVDDAKGSRPANDVLDDTKRIPNMPMMML